jgi:hypothetical protein
VVPSISTNTNHPTITVKMPITCKACHLCNDSVKGALDRVGVPYTYTHVGQTSIYHVTISSPSTWTANSLAMQCWYVKVLAIVLFHDLADSRVHCAS